MKKSIIEGWQATFNTKVEEVSKSLFLFSILTRKMSGVATQTVSSQLCWTLSVVWQVERSDPPWWQVSRRYLCTRNECSTSANANIPGCHCGIVRNRITTRSHLQSYATYLCAFFRAQLSGIWKHKLEFDLTHRQVQLKASLCSILNEHGHVLVSKVVPSDERIHVENLLKSLWFELGEQTTHVFTDDSRKG